MAKTENGILDGFVGKVGTVVGYKWNGKACMRAYVRNIKNPRTEMQVAHREMFKQEVQLAAKMRWAVGIALRDLAREAGMTAYNLFVKANQHAFAFADGSLQVDYSALHLSFGDVPQVEMPSATRTEDNRLTVRFRRGRGADTDYVYLYAFVPDLGEGYLSAPVYRHEKRLSLLLPDRYAGHEVHLYLMVQHAGGRWSNSLYVGCLDDSVQQPQVLPAAIPGLRGEVGVAESLPSPRAQSSGHEGQPPESRQAPWQPPEGGA